MGLDMQPSIGRGPCCARDDLKTGLSCADGGEPESEYGGKHVFGRVWLSVKKKTLGLYTSSSHPVRREPRRSETIAGTEGSMRRDGQQRIAAVD